MAKAFCGVKAQAPLIPKYDRYIYQAQISCSITGFSDGYWSCYCFADEFAYEFCRLDGVQTNDSEAEGGDPIICQARGARTLCTRTYLLQAFARNASHVVDSLEKIWKALHDQITDHVSPLAMMPHHTCNSQSLTTTVL